MLIYCMHTHYVGHFYIHYKDPHRCFESYICYSERHCARYYGNRDADTQTHQYLRGKILWKQTTYKACIRLYLHMILNISE